MSEQEAEEVTLGAPVARPTPMSDAAVSDALAKLARASQAQMVDANTAHHALSTELFGQGHIEGRLPVGAVIEGVVYDRVQVREMTGHEDSILADVKLNFSERLARCAGECIVSLTSRSDPTKKITDKELIRKIVDGTLDQVAGLPFTTADRHATMILVRRASIGDAYNYEVVCSHPLCGKKSNKLVLDLTKLELKYSDRPDKRFVRAKLPGSQKTIVIKIPDGASERRMTELRQADEGNGEDLFSVLALTVLEELDSVKLRALPIKEQFRRVKELTARDRTFIRELGKKITPTVDLNIEYQCRHCNHETNMPLDIGQVFISTPDMESDTDLEWI